MSVRRVTYAIRGAAVGAWARWKLIAHVIGNFQARLLLSVFYFVVVPPFALIVKLKDPLGLRRKSAGSGWVDRPTADTPSGAARRQF